jgi:hypothetical protein
MAAFKSLKGLIFGNLIVLELAGKTSYGKLQWKCLCVCGNESIVTGTPLTQGKTRSCGCLHRKRITTRNGNSRHPNYWVWIDMIRRCSDPSRLDYCYYGKRGIKVDERWKCFDTFVADVGDRPSANHTLDRIDTNGNYTKSNCRWLHKSEQNSNKRNNRLIEFNGEVLSLKQWSSRLAISESTIRTRLNKGIPIEQALLIPPRTKATSITIQN